MTETTGLNLYQRINAIRKEVDYIQKDKSVSTGGGGSYKAVTHDQVTAILRKHLITYGVVCIPSLVASHANDRLADAKQFRYDATYSFDFVNCDKPDEKLTIVIEAHAMDNADKAPGKALSYAKKYAVLKLFEIETGDDEESRYLYEPDTEPEDKPKTTVPLPKSKKTKAAEPATPAAAVDSVPAETGEIKWTLAKLNALVEVTPADVLVEAGCGELDPDTLDGLTKQQFASIKQTLKGVH